MNDFVEANFKKSIANCRGGDYYIFVVVASCADAKGVAGENTGANDVGAVVNWVKFTCCRL